MQKRDGDKYSWIPGVLKFKGTFIECTTKDCKYVYNLNFLMGKFINTMAINFCLRCSDLEFWQQNCCLRTTIFVVWERNCCSRTHSRNSWLCEIFLSPNAWCCLRTSLRWDLEKFHKTMNFCLFSENRKILSFFKFWLSADE